MTESVDLAAAVASRVMVSARSVGAAAVPLRRPGRPDVSGGAMTESVDLAAAVASRVISVWARRWRPLPFPFAAPAARMSLGVR
ncbi:hypothetical protein DQ384_08245 [Sphaerisporangium album]|uniref:Uncharacterized protein n=1 Tax=Sphaerisporangium album TaxID=509200 RepID=A0A367FPB9_9ACTN|nr:hypothetical protein [Sphaerisporangium album]RCG31557.1 hypothetical protein DQ384_08245 [Sphaerisporangium album]